MHRPMVVIGMSVALVLAACGDSDSPPWVVGSSEGGAAGSAGAAGLGGQAGSGGHQHGGAAGAAGSATGGSATGGSATGGSATGGSATGGGSTGGSGTGGSSGGGPSAGCTELDKCCEELGTDMYSACKNVVQQNYEASCLSVLDSYHTNGYCTGSAACSDLAACCPQLPPGQGWKDTCDYYVQLANAPQCEYLLGVYQQDGYCN